MAKKLNDVQRRLQAAKEAREQAEKLEQDALQSTYLALGKIVYDSALGDVPEEELRALFGTLREIRATGEMVTEKSAEPKGKSKPAKKATIEIAGEAYAAALEDGVSRYATSE